MAVPPSILAPLFYLFNFFLYLIIISEEESSQSSLLVVPLSLFTCKSVLSYLDLQQIETS